MAETAVPPSGCRIIVKQGYLKKISTSTKLCKTWKKPEKRWCVFGFIQEGSKPYLEYYPNEEAIFTGEPMKFIYLTHVQHVMPGLLPDKEGYAFTVIAADKEHTLIANTRVDMMDWVKVMQNLLRQSNNLQEGGENPYVIEQLPSRLRPAISTDRQHMPLPPLPANSVENFQDTPLPPPLPIFDPPVPSERPLPPLPDSPTLPDCESQLGSAGATSPANLIDFDPVFDLEPIQESVPVSPSAPLPLDHLDGTEPPLPPRASQSIPPRTLTPTTTPDRPPPPLPLGQSQTLPPPKPPRPKTLPASVAYSTDTTNAVLGWQTTSHTGTSRAKGTSSGLGDAARALADLAKQNKPLPAVPSALQQRPLPSPPIESSSKEDKPLPPTPVYAVSTKDRASTLPVNVESSLSQLAGSSLNSSQPASNCESQPDSIIHRKSTFSSQYIDRPLPPPPADSDAATAPPGVTQNTLHQSPTPKKKPPRPPPPCIKTASRELRNKDGANASRGPSPELTSPLKPRPTPAPRITRITSGSAVDPLKPNKRPVPTPRRSSKGSLCESNNVPGEPSCNHTGEKPRVDNEEPEIDSNQSEVDNKEPEVDSNPSEVDNKEPELNNNTLGTHCGTSEGCGTPEEELPPPYSVQDPNLPLPYSEIDPLTETVATKMYTSTGHRLDLNFASNGVLQTSSGEPLELDFDFDPRAESPPANSPQRADLNFFPGATVVDMFDESPQPQQSQGDDEVYEPLWDKDGSQNTSGLIPPPPSTPRRSTQTRSPSVDSNGTNQQPLVRRTSRQLSVVSGTARSAGDEATACDQGVVAGARSPGHADPKGDAVIDLPGLPKSERSVKRRTVSLPEPQSFVLPPPVTPRQRQSVTSTPSATQTSSPVASPSPQQPVTPQATAAAAVRQMTPQPVRPVSSDASAEPISPLVTPVRPQNETHAPISVGGAVYLTSPGPMSMSPQAGGEDLGPFTGMSEKMLEAMGLGDDAVGGWNAPPPDEGAPPPYMPRSVLNRGAQKSLKQSQVELLQKEISHAGGVKVTLRRTDCHHTLVLVDAFGAVWLAGMNQKARPFLHNAFHIGDQVLSINLQVIENAKMAYKLIKNSGADDKVIFIIKRVPRARVFAMRRDEDGQDLGIRREGGTAEIIDVVPFGIAARHGVPAKAPTMDGTNLCHWWITEINSRPLNLNFKGDEIEHRLNAVGRDISIMLQPMEFIVELKAQLKLIRNYKDFLLQ